MEVWVVVSSSCRACNAMGIATFSHEPIEEEVNSVEIAIGGMWCITTEVIKTEVDGDIKEVNKGEI